MSIAGETSPASPGHRVHQGDSIMEKGRRKKSSKRRSNSSNGVRADVGSVFARERDPFFNMTHLLSPGSCTRPMFTLSGIGRSIAGDAPDRLPTSLLRGLCRGMPTRLLLLFYRCSQGRPTV